MPRFPAAGRGYAEYVVVPAEELVKTPASLDDEHAAAIPLAGLTAWQALADLVTAGKLAPHVSGVFPLEKAGDAHTQLAEGALGKIVLVP